MTALGSAKPTKFTNVTPGSRINIIDAENPLEPIEALALDVLPEWGPHRIPAITYLITGTKEPRMVMATGRYTVQVLTSSTSLADLALTVKGAVTGRSRPVDIHAIQFLGTLDSGRDCVLYASGKAAVRLDTSTDPLTLTVGGVAPTVLQPGDWLVLEEHVTVDDKVSWSVKAVAPNDFATQYVVDEA